MITLATLPTATAQEVFDQVVNHLRQQGEKSIDKNGNCCYRHTDAGKTTRCAAGCLISDDEYDQGLMETLLWRPNSHKWVPEEHAHKWVPEEHAHIIRELQRIHDGCNVDDWEARLEQLAERHGLNYTI